MGCDLIFKIIDVIRKYYKCISLHNQPEDVLHPKKKNRGCRASDRVSIYLVHSFQLLGGDRPLSKTEGDNNSRRESDKRLPYANAAHPNQTGANAR
jgi:hypothetical protein